jgi:hypothetical protein
MFETALSGLLDGSLVDAAPRIVAGLLGLVLGVRLLAAGGRTADDRDRTLVEAARRRGATRQAPLQES